MANVTGSEEGLRARKKRQTRDAIVQTAAQLFAERGYDAVTIGEVARTANVSEQTVYNYFPTKEHLVFDRAEAFENELRALILNRPAGSGLLGGLRPGIMLFIDRSVRAPSPGGMPRLVAVSPALRRSWLDLTDRVAGSLAQSLAEESGGDLPGPTARILASSIMAVVTTIVYELGTAESLEPRVVDELKRAVSLALDHLERGLGIL